MSEWKEAQLADYIDVISGFAFKSTNFIEKQEKGSLPVIKIKNVANGDVNFDNVVYHKYDTSLSKYVLNIGDLLIAMTGNHPQALTQVVGDVSRYKLNEISLLNQRVGKIISKGDTDLDFIYYLLKEKDTRNYLANHSSGSANQANISKANILELTVNIPPFKEQKVIGSVLKSIDDKIDLLQNQNIVIEKLAKTIFRQKFIEEATGDWENEKLGNIAEVQNGYAFSSKDYVEFQINHLEVLKMGHIEKGGGLRKNPKKDYVPRSEKLKRWILNKGDIIMAMTDMKDNVVILGVPAMIDKNDNYVLNQRVARLFLKSNKKLINNYLLFIQLMDSEFISILQSKANSGVQVNLSTETIKDCDIIIPPIQIQNEIGSIITDLYLKKENNDSQIQSLSKLRDVLLPKLINKEVSIEQ